MTTGRGGARVIRRAPGRGGRLLLSRGAAVLALASGLMGLTGCGTGGVESIEPFLDDTLPPGSSGALVAGRGDTMDVCRGWGEPDEETGERAGCDTVFDIMSMTKQFTAAAVVRLSQDGRLDVGDPLADHLPGVPADKQAVTIEHLLTHTSGLLDTLGPDDDPLTRGAFLRQALGSELLSEPGTTYRYSNVGYSLLTAVVEEVSGQDYEAYLAEHLFAPAGMTSTGYVLPDWSALHVAVEHDATGRPQGTPLDHPWADDGPYWNLRGNGGLLSTPRDMFRWHVALRGDEVLDDDAKHRLFEPRVREEPDETYYAYGWVADDRDDPQIFWHNGGNGRAYGEIGRDPAGEVFVFWVANRAAGDGWDLGESGTDLTSGLFERLRVG